jgi:hypothetical protein
VHGKHELQLFQKLALDQQQFDAEAMALQWCDHVDGITIFPKLPVYLRTHHEAWKKNQRVKDAVDRKQADLAMLETLNMETEQQLAPEDEADDNAGASSSSSGGGIGGHVSGAGGGGGGGGGGAPGASRPPLVQPTTQHPGGFGPYMGMAPPIPHTVAGMVMALSAPVPPLAGGKRKAGAGGRPKGSKNRKPRAKPTCKKCGLVWPACPGGAPTGTCNSMDEASESD